MSELPKPTDDIRQWFRSGGHYEKLVIAELDALEAERDALQEALELMVDCANCLGWGNAEIENAETVLAAIASAEKEATPPLIDAAKGGSND